MRVVSVALSVILGIGSSVKAHAWGADGHRIIAAIAQSNLNPAAANEVARLLQQEPGATLVSISTWADEHRNPTTAAWHYVNFPKSDCQYVKERDCPNGKCVIEAIRKQSRVLQTETNDEKRLTALKYLVHLVGDVHQPLHAGWGEDQGGNTYQLQALMRGSNLHSWWDTGMIKYLEEQEGPLLEKVRLRKQVSLSKDWTPEAAALESCHIVERDGFYPGRLVDVRYVDKFKDTLTNRLQAAGLRLAELLNRILELPP